MLVLATYFIGFIATFLFVVISYYKRAFTYWSKWDIPTFNPKIPFGDLENLFTRKTSRILELRRLYTKVKKLGYKHLGMYQLASPTYFVVDTELIKNICIKDFDHFTNRNFYYNEKDDPISVHLFAMEGQRWKDARSRTSTIFTANRLKWMFQNMLDVTKATVEHIDKIIEQNEMPIEAKKLTSCFTLDAAGSSILGIKCCSFTDPEQNFLKYGHRALETDRLGQIVLLLGCYFPKFFRFFKIRQIAREVSQFFIKNISETMFKRRERNVQRKDFLQLLMNLQEDTESEKPLSEAEVISLSFGLFVGAFETSATTMAFLLFHLAEHPVYQEKLREEVNRVLKKYDNQLTYESLQDMTYMTQCLDEVMRMYPPVPTINRVCTKEYKVPGEDLVIEKDIKVLIIISGVHYDPEYYERPNEFYPDHFSDENRKKRPAMAFMPFGEGPRKCIGARYGRLQVRSAIATLITRYRFSISNKMELPIELSPTSFIPLSKNGIWLNVEKV